MILDTYWRKNSGTNNLCGKCEHLNTSTSWCTHYNCIVPFNYRLEHMKCFECRRKECMNNESKS